MILNNIRSPKILNLRRSFRPGILLCLFVSVFLPLFVSLGFWQLNRAQQKDQLLALGEGASLVASDINWSEPPLYRETVVTGTLLDEPIFLLDNKTNNGVFGYEVFSLLNAEEEYFLISLGWVAGSLDRSIVPRLEIPLDITNQSVTIRPAPKNPVFGIDANIAHETNSNIWVVQTLTPNWLESVAGFPVSGFLQLNSPDIAGVGPGVWQPSVMSPAKHRGYALQWFSMAVALLGMFLYAGFKNSHREPDANASDSLEQE
jgi:cytochrome oxidase assembly protein ShyY1